MQPRFCHKNMRPRTKPFRSNQRACRGKNKKTLDAPPFTCTRPRGDACKNP